MSRGYRPFLRLPARSPGVDRRPWYPVAESYEPIVQSLNMTLFHSPRCNSTSKVEYTVLPFDYAEIPPCPNGRRADVGGSRPFRTDRAGNTNCAVSRGREGAARVRSSLGETVRADRYAKDHVGPDAHRLESGPGAGRHRQPRI